MGIIYLTPDSITAVGAASNGTGLWQFGFALGGEISPLRASPPNGP